MLVVSDATPLNVLIRAGYAGVLNALFGTVVIPMAVAAELTHDATPQVVRDWLRNRPAWLAIKAPKQLDAGAPRNRGEREAISLAKELGADLFLADDARARAAAMRIGIPVVGTIGVLEASAAKRLIDLRRAIASLPPDFLLRLNPRLIEDALTRDARRNQA
jgi:predicted nucleic acid-binding protein